MSGAAIWLAIGKFTQSHWLISPIGQPVCRIDSWETDGQTGGVKVRKAVESSASRRRSVSATRWPSVLRDQSTDHSAG